MIAKENFRHRPHASVAAGDRILQLFSAQADRRGVASLSYREISAETGLSRRVVRRAVDSLADRRLIGVMARFDDSGAQLANDILVLPAPRGAR